MFGKDGFINYLLIDIMRKKSTLSIKYLKGPHMFSLHLTNAENYFGEKN